MLYAKWIDHYNITYVLNGGALPSNAETSYIGGEKFTLPIPTNGKLEFLGWYLESNFINKIAVISDYTGDLVLYAKQDILKTRYEVQENANMELIRLYFRLGKIVSENAKYGNNFIKDFSIALKLEFPDSTGFSTRNLSRMKKFYEEYKDLSNLPPEVAKLPWTHNY